MGYKFGLSCDKVLGKPAAVAAAAAAAVAAVVVAAAAAIAAADEIDEMEAEVADTVIGCAWFSAVTKSSKTQTVQKRYKCNSIAKDCITVARIVVKCRTDRTDHLHSSPDTCDDNLLPTSSTYF